MDHSARTSRSGAALLKQPVGAAARRRRRTVSDTRADVHGTGNPTLDVVSSKGPVTQRHGEDKRLLVGGWGRVSLQSADPGPRPGAAPRPDWLIVDHLPLFHRSTSERVTAASRSCMCTASGSRGPTRSPLQPCSRRSTRHTFPTSRDGRSLRPRHGLDLPGTRPRACRVLRRRGGGEARPGGELAGRSDHHRGGSELPGTDRQRGAGLARGRSQQPADGTRLGRWPRTGSGSHRRCCRSPYATTCASAPCRVCRCSRR